MLLMPWISIKLLIKILGTVISHNQPFSLPTTHWVFSKHFLFGFTNPSWCYCICTWTTGYNPCTLTLVSAPEEDPCTKPFGGDGCFIPSLSHLKYWSHHLFTSKLGRFNVCVGLQRNVHIVFFFLERPILHVLVKLVASFLQLSNAWG